MPLRSAISRSAISRSAISRSAGFRLAAGLTVSSIAVASVTACGASTQVPGNQAGVSSPAPAQTSAAYPQCHLHPNETTYETCIYGINNIQVYTGPNQLGPADLTRQSIDDSQAVSVTPWPATWSAAGNLPSGCPNTTNAQWCAYYKDGNGAQTNAVYSAPAQLSPPDQAPDLISLDAGGWNFDCNGVTPPLRFVTCAPVWSDGGSFSNYVFEVGNLPLTIMVNNNLPATTTTGSPPTTEPSHDTLQLQNQPVVNGLILDPKGGDPTQSGSAPATIQPGMSGFFGTYLPAAPTGTPSISFSYEVPMASKAYGGTIFTINVPITKGTVAVGSSYASSPVCSVLTTISNSTAYCGVGLVGTAGGPQTLIINIGA